MPPKAKQAARRAAAKAKSDAHGPGAKGTGKGSVADPSCACCAAGGCPRAANNLSAAVPLGCPICIETIWPCESIKLSLCHPVAHVSHMDCWWGQSEPQQEYCCVCRQREVCRPTAIAVYTRFPTTSPGFSSDALWGDPTLEWFSLAGQGLIKGFVRHELSRDELNRILEAAPRRPNYDEFMNAFIRLALNQGTT